jgi:lipopolysaccharide export system protein LptA
MKLSWMVLAVGAYAAFLQGDEEHVTINAGLVQYHGKTISLNGDVELEHDLGKISAQSVELNTPAGEKKIRLGTLDLAKDVRISLKDGGVLECAEAKIDFKTLQGNFRGDDKQGYAIYSENCKNKANPSERIPLIFKSKQMAVQFAKDNLNGVAYSKGHISSILADSSVTIDYNHDFIAQSDTATYEKEEGPAKTAIAGLVSLRASGPDGLCRVTNRNGDLINASTICIDTVARQLCFAYPKGVMNASRREGVLEKIEFSADTLSWDMHNNLLVLRDHVILNQKGLGTLTNDKEIRLSQKNDRLGTIESDGKTVVVVAEETKNVEHHLTCYGKVTVDHAKLEMFMESPRNTQGDVIEGQQVFFEDPIGVIYADKVTLKYALENKTIAPKVLILEGNVKMMNTYASEDPSSPLVQYALADKVEYYPQTKEVVFSSNGSGKRVLFYDKTHDLQVSAPVLKIKRDKATKKDLIKGTGDVRFSFIENEFVQLRNRFSLSNFKEKGIHGSK